MKDKEKKEKTNMYQISVNYGNISVGSTLRVIEVPQGQDRVEVGTERNISRNNAKKSFQT